MIRNKCGLFLLAAALLSACTHKSPRELLVDQKEYVISQEGSPLFTVAGVEGEWWTIPSHFERGFFSLYGSITQYGTSESWRIVLGKSELLISNYQNMGMIVNNDYSGYAEFAKSNMTNEYSRRVVGIRDSDAAPASLWGFQCVQRSQIRGGGAPVVTLMSGIRCPVIVDGQLWTLSAAVHWPIHLTEGESLLPLDDMVRASWSRIQPILDNVQFLVELSQNPENLQEPVPSLPEGLTYMDFYLNYIPEYYHHFHSRATKPWPASDHEHVSQVKSSGMTLEMAKEWKAYVDRIHTLDRKRLEAVGADPSNRTPAKDFAELFEMVLELWDEVP